MTCTAGSRFAVQVQRRQMKTIEQSLSIVPTHEWRWLDDYKHGVFGAEPFTMQSLVGVY